MSTVQHSSKVEDPTVTVFFNWCIELRGSQLYMASIERKSGLSLSHSNSPTLPRIQPFKLSGCSGLEVGIARTKFQDFLFLPVDLTMEVLEFWSNSRTSQNKNGSSLEIVSQFISLHIDISYAEVKGREVCYPTKLRRFQNADRSCRLKFPARNLQHCYGHMAA
ncbi:hypothetical protein E6O75_ATG02939 [Venturia nashicola]|uniref:Uncharacterized protein n=1 Tax=Venturia nashicola TaxID=86259 RepID=A0A4Z1P3A1_9PEZI|nr:hypothetical protein E6O75_ATG02939 [Venturia nashicola]